MRAPSHTRLTLALLALLALLIVGCGSSSDETGGGGETQGGAEATTSTTPNAPPGVVSKSCGEMPQAGSIRVVTGTCGFARATVTAWARHPECASPPGASRSSCKFNGLLCLSTSVDRGLAVSCAEPGRSVAFIVKPD